MAINFKEEVMMLLEADYSSAASIIDGIKNNKITIKGGKKILENDDFSDWLYYFVTNCQEKKIQISKVLQLAIEKCKNDFGKSFTKLEPTDYDALSLYIKYKSSPNFKDLIKELETTNMSLKKFHDEALEKAENTRNGKRALRKAQTSDADIEVLYDKNGWTVKSPKTWQASVKAATFPFGKAKWCTASSQAESMFDTYTDNGKYPLMIVSGGTKETTFQFAMNGDDCENFNQEESITLKELKNIPEEVQKAISFKGKNVYDFVKIFEKELKNDGFERIDIGNGVKRELRTAKRYLSSTFIWKNYIKNKTNKIESFRYKNNQYKIKDPNNNDMFVDAFKRKGESAYTKNIERTQYKKATAKSVSVKMSELPEEVKYLLPKSSEPDSVFYVQRDFKVDPKKAPPLRKILTFITKDDKSIKSFKNEEVEEIFDRMPSFRKKIYDALSRNTAARVLDTDGKTTNVISLKGFKPQNKAEEKIKEIAQKRNERMSRDANSMTKDAFYSKYEDSLTPTMEKFNKGMKQRRTKFDSLRRQTFSVVDDPIFWKLYSKVYTKHEINKDKKLLIADMINDKSYRESYGHVKIYDYGEHGVSFTFGYGLDSLESESKIPEERKLVAHILAKYYKDFLRNDLIKGAGNTLSDIMNGNSLKEEVINYFPY